MKRVVNIEDLILYLLSEDAIGDDDPPKLTVSGHLSKTQALVNLQQIIATRGTTEQFMRALECSSEVHAGHKELYDAMVGERQRRMSVSSRRSSASRRTRSSITSQTQLIPVLETSPQADPSSSEEPPPTIIVAESTGASVTHSTSAASPSNTGQDTETAPSIRRISQPQIVESAAADNHQHPEIKSELYAIVDVVCIDLAILSCRFLDWLAIWRYAFKMQLLSAATANKVSCIKFYPYFMQDCELSHLLWQLLLSLLLFMVSAVLLE